MPDNKQEPNSGGEELEGLIAEKDEALAAKDQRIAVARNIPAAEMALGRKVAVIFFDDYNARDAVVAAVYS